MEWSFGHLYLKRGVTKSDSLPSYSCMLSAAPLFAYNAINANRKAWVYLFMDVLIGLNSFLIYHIALNN